MTGVDDYGLFFYTRTQLFYNFFFFCHPLLVDSLVTRPVNEDISLFTSIYDNDFETLPFTVQARGTNTCGLYVLYFLHGLCKGRTISELMQAFSSTDLKYNDKVVTAWFRSLNIPKSLYKEAKIYHGD